MNMFKGNVQCTYQFHKCTVYRLLAVQSLRRTIEPQRKPAGAHCMCLTGVLFLANLYIAYIGIYPSDYHNIKLSRSNDWCLVAYLDQDQGVCKVIFNPSDLPKYPINDDPVVV